MSVDPAQDMPLANWRPTGSFPVPVTIPSAGPADGTLVQLPCINQDWLLLLMGCLEQLRIPATWLGTDSDIDGVLQWVTQLQEMMWGAFIMPCCNLAMRLTSDCALQYSVDGGTTYTDVDGWSTYFVSCVLTHLKLRLSDTCELQWSIDDGTSWTTFDGWVLLQDSCFGGNIATGAPANPQSLTTTEMACAVATFLAYTITKDALQQAVDSVNTDKTLLQYSVNIMDSIPAFPLTSFALAAFADIYGVVQGGTITDYENALDDPSLWELVKCAIYSAISADGYVTDANAATVASNIAAISYSPSDVITAISGWVTAIGARGLEELQQMAGLETGADCTDCGTSTAWAYQFDATGTLGDLSLWVDSPYSTYTSGSGLKSVLMSGDQILIGQKTFPSTNIVAWRATYHRNYGANGGTDILEVCDAGTCFDHNNNGAAGDHVEVQCVNGTATKLKIEVDTSQTGQAGDTTVSRIEVWGTGICPFGPPNIAIAVPAGC